MLVAKRSEKTPLRKYIDLHFGRRLGCNIDETFTETFGYH